jgi:DNA-binding MarR family transcriptional regulator
MNSYLDEIADSLTINDLSVLGVLTDHKVDAKFKSMKKSRLRELSKLSIADFRKVVHRLEIAKFLEVVTGQKEHRIFITEFGRYAIEKSLEKMNEGKEISEQISETSPEVKVRKIKSFANKSI